MAIVGADADATAVARLMPLARCAVICWREGSREDNRMIDGESKREEQGYGRRRADLAMRVVVRPAAERPLRCNRIPAVVRARRRERSCQLGSQCDDPIRWLH